MKKGIYVGACLACLCTTHCTTDITLYNAVFHKDLSKLKELIANKETQYINTASYLTAPPLIVAAQNGDLESIKVLLEAGAKVNIFDRSGRTALHWAVSMEHIPVIYALLLAEADMYAKNGGTSALDEAKNAQIRTILLSRPQARQEIETLCQATHERLGKESTAQKTPQPAFDLIFHHLRLKSDQNP